MSGGKQIVGDTVDAGSFSADEKQSSKTSFTVVIQELIYPHFFRIKQDRGQNSGFTVDSANIIENDNEKQEIRNIAAKLVAVGNEAMINAEIKEQNRSDLLDAGSFKQTLSSVRAEPTVLISEDDWKYNQDFPSIGVCVIINNKNFLLPELDTRHGTDEDEKEAERTFIELGYKVIVRKDLTKKQMKQELEKVSNEDHSKNASFVCVILSHGNQDGIFGTDKLLTLDDLAFYFKGHETLIGKPKLFFLQACRGSKLDDGTTCDRDMVDAAVIPTPKKIPVEADFLYAYATVPGFYAWRNGQNGSWFIQSLCEILSKHKDLELMQIMTRVNRKVAFEYQSNNNDPKFHGKKEIPCITSMLTKEFYFTKKA